VTTAVRTVDVRELGGFLTEQREPGDYVAFEVRDTGGGMDEETLKRIFDPFFTTKFLGRGLGLSAGLGIIRGHKGAVRVTSAPGQGTVFEVLFPAMAEAAMPVEPAEEPAFVEGQGSILVVDDEAVVRNFLQQALTRAGYEVRMAENGQEALAILSGPDPISLVLLDLVMPVMSGEEVLPHLIALRPGAPVIVSSGQSEEECMRKLRGAGVAGFLQKPYKLGALTAKLRQVLAESGAQSPGERAAGASCHAAPFPMA
jgi:CheY-like chemotaxis protein